MSHALLTAILKISPSSRPNSIFALVLISGPWVSIINPIGKRVSWHTFCILFITKEFHWALPCDMLSLAMFIPFWANSLIDSSLSVFGPIVHIIFVLLMFPFPFLLRQYGLLTSYYQTMEAIILKKMKAKSAPELKLAAKPKILRIINLT